MQRCSAAFFFLLLVACKQQGPATPAAPDAHATQVAAPVDAHVTAAAADAARAPSPPDAAAPAKAELKPSGSRVGVAVCDEYLDKMARCITRISAEAQPPMRNAMDESRKAWQDNARTPEGRAALETTCKQALDAAKSAAAAMGCEW
jgi:hypothetical protein